MYPNQASNSRLSCLIQNTAGIIASTPAFTILWILQMYNRTDQNGATVMYNSGGHNHAALQYPSLELSNIESFFGSQE